MTSDFPVVMPRFQESPSNRWMPDPARALIDRSGHLVRSNSVINSPPLVTKYTSRSAALHLHALICCLSGAVGDYDAILVAGPAISAS